MATGDIKISYAASSAATITLTTLAQGSARQGLAWANNGSNYTDGSVLITLKTTSGTHGANFACYAHFYASVDGTNWTNPCTTSTDAALTITTGMNLAGPMLINFGTSVTGLYAATAVVGSVASIYGGRLPANFGVVIENQTNLAFTNVAGDFNLIFFPTFENVST